MTNRELIRRIKTRRVVTMKRGSWQWQDAFCVVTYAGTERKADGMVVYRSAEHGPKRSEPQLRSERVQMPTGSLHNKPVPRVEAVAAIGAGRVRRLEGAGFRFA